jgi:hypothetical protein
VFFHTTLTADMQRKKEVCKNTSLSFIYQALQNEVNDHFRVESPVHCLVCVLLKEGL